MNEFKESHEETPEEMATYLIDRFHELRNAEKEIMSEPPSAEYHTSENQAMAEDDAASFRVEKAEDYFADCWRDDVDPKIKQATIQKLLDMGREDVVKEITRLNDITSLVDQETLKKLQG